MSVSEQASNDLRAARVILHKLGQTFTDFQSHSFSIVSLGEQWKNLQNSLSTLHSLLENRVKEIESEEREITMIGNKFQILQKQVELRQKGLDFAEKSLSERLESVEVREKQVKEWCDSLNLEKRLIGDRCKAVELMEKQFSEGFERLGKVEERENEVMKREEACCAREELKEKVTISEKGEELSVRERELNVREKELNEIYEGMKLKEGNMNTKEVKLEEYRKELELKEKELDELLNAFQSNEKEVKEKSNMLALKEKEIDSRYREVEVKEQELNEKLDELKVKEEKLSDNFDVLELQGKKIDEQRQVLKLKAKEVDELRLALTLKEKQLNEDRKARDLEEKRVVESCKEMEEKLKEAREMSDKRSRSFRKAKRKELNEQCQTKGSEENQVSAHYNGEHLPDSVGIDVNLNSMCKNMDVEGLRSYLIERVQEQKQLNEKILDALRCAPDPAKLALGVFQNFHRRLQSKCHGDANKASCIFVLEQLMKLSPPITDEVKVEAQKYAAFCKISMERSAMGSFGFLLLLAAFKLPNLYSADYLLTQFNGFFQWGDINWLEENSYLCNALGLLNKIPAFVTSLIKRKKRFLAIKYICIFKLECDFQLVPLLEAQLTHVKNRVEDRRKDGTLKSKTEADAMELNSLRDLIKYVSYFKLESKFPIDSLSSRVNELEKEKKVRKPNAVAPTKRRSADSCVSEAISDQLEKRHRVGDVHQVAPLHRALCPLPVPHTLGHATHHINSSVQPAWQQGTTPVTNGLNYGVGPHLGSMPFVPPGMCPRGAHRPSY